MAGFRILPRSKQTCHCLTKTGLGAMSQVGTERNDILSILPVDFVRASREGWHPLPSLGNAAHRSRMLRR